MVELRRSARVAAVKREAPGAEDGAEDGTAVPLLVKKVKIKPGVAKKLKTSSKPIKKSKQASISSEEERQPPSEDEELTKPKGEEQKPVEPPKEAEEDVTDSSDATAQSTELDIGDEIPDLTLKNQDGDDVSLRTVAKNNRIIIMFAYPKASTPGCTRQACGFRDNYEDLKKHAAVFGLSGDAVAAQKKFQTKQSLPFDLLSDPKRTLIGYLGAKKTPQSGTLRSHWVFVDGKLKYKRVKISPEVSVQDGKKEVLELAEKLQKD